MASEPVKQNSARPNAMAGDPVARMKIYLGKIAAGPRMSKDLTAEEAEDAMNLILTGSVSPVQSGVFLIAARMKGETVPETLGFWRALDKTTIRQSVPFNQLLQIADPFDGFNRIPYFGFYTIPVISVLGLPVYGHSSLPLPPKMGITFEEILTHHYQAPFADDGEKRKALFLKHEFGYFSTAHTHPLLERLRNLRMEIVKRPTLATLEKMLQPLTVSAGGNFLATGYFHRGYEIPMMAVARESGFDKTVLGNGMEGTTFYGVHKESRIFIETREQPSEERKLNARDLFSGKTAEEIHASFQDLKQANSSLPIIAQYGEQALRGKGGPADALIACHAGTLCGLFGRFSGFQEAFDSAREALKTGKTYDKLMRYLEGSIDGS